MSLRFVILLHDIGGQVADRHWDLMLELPGRQKLASWRVKENPATWAAGRKIVIERIADHRRIYLDYEGEISGGRGAVSRVDGGTVQPGRVQEGLISGQFCGETFQQFFELREIADYHWEMVLRVNDA